MIIIDEIVTLLQSRNFSVDPKELKLFKVPRVKLPNDYCLRFSDKSGEYEAYITHKSRPPVTWHNLDEHSLILALDYAEKVSGIAPQASIEHIPQFVIQPVQQAAVEHSLPERSMPLAVTAFAIFTTAFAIIAVLSVSIKFKSCNCHLTPPVQLPVNNR